MNKFVESYQVHKIKSKSLDYFITLNFLLSTSKSEIC